MANQWTEKYWTKRYDEGNTGWDIGYVSTPLRDYFDQLSDKEIKILIPGCGNAYEAEYLFNSGFKNVSIIDLSEKPLQNFKEKVNAFPDEQLIVGDFFEHEEKYDLIIEQTFFCALDPVLREKYAQKMLELLKPHAKLVGLLFNIPLFSDHPPFGGNENDYRKLFERYFEIKIMAESYNSIPPRMGNELFFQLINSKV